MIGRTVSAFPSLLRVGVAVMVAYRAEFFIWVFTSTMPLIMLALMYTVSSEAPVQGFGAGDFLAYYLGVLLVRQFTVAWVAWELTQNIKQGTLGLRLLRPVSPLVTYATENLGAIPLRGLVAIPLTILLLIFAGPEHLALNFKSLSLFGLSIAGGWFITFCLSSCIGTLSFFYDSALALHQLYYGLFVVFSGYLLPLSLFPNWIGGVNVFLPFRYQMSVPVEILLGRLTGAAAVEALFFQWAWVAALILILTMLWRAGLRRYAAFGS